MQNHLNYIIKLFNYFCFVFFINVLVLNIVIFLLQMFLRLYRQSEGSLRAARFLFLVFHLFADERCRYLRELHIRLRRLDSFR